MRVIGSIVNLIYNIKEQLSIVNTNNKLSEVDIYIICESYEVLKGVGYTSRHKI